MKSRCLFILVVSVSLLFSACTRKVNHSKSPDLTDTSQNEEILISTVHEKPTSSLILQPLQWNGYTGYSDGGRNYHYLYSEGRDRRWEEIIVQLADDFLDPLRGHPYLTSRDITRAVIDENFSLSYSDPTLSRVNVFDEKKKNMLIEDINTLISDVPGRTDTEIAFSFRKIFAKIYESHTRFLYLTRYAYPLRFRALHRDGKNHIYCTAAPRANSNVLGCKLVSVNGCSIPELAERLASYSYAPDDEEPVSNILDNGLLYEWDALQIAGVIGWSDDTAEFSFETCSGEQITATIPKMEFNQWREFFQPDYSGKTYVEIPKPYYKSRNEAYWHDMLDDRTLYIRVSTFREDPGDFPLEIKKIAEEKGSLTKVILDLRDNTGGHYKPGLSNYIRNINAEKIYIFTNRLTQSAGIVTAQGLRKHCSNVTVVGDYGWHTNFLGDPRTKKIEDVPTFGEFEFTIPYRAIQTSETTDLFSESTELFTPDVFLYFEYEDYVEGRDTFLEWIKNQ